ncbi:MAG: pyridoxal phosphate-dependent aminotransferase [Gammaproteobacteria bacterium]|nr:pyridoxal phosphate-dependent aminotransferase [Gammaproteobacteria bacterium]
MTIKLAERLSAVKPSPTLAITARAAAMRAQGKDIIGLGAGEPDFDTPDHIKQAAIEALDSGFTKYTPVDGTPGLKSAIIDKFKTDNGLSYETDQILVSVGGKQSFYNLAQALLGPGDEVIIPAPYWVSYPDMVLLAGAQPVIIDTDQTTNLKITPEQLRAAISDNTKLFVINSPSNPSGLAYTLDELKALAKVLLEYPDIVIATDDMYEHILWDSTFCNILNSCPELYDRTVTLNGVSKAYSMTGWRIGYAGGPREVIQAMKKIQSQSTSNPTSISQVAAEAALRGDQSCVTAMVKEFRTRHDRVVQLLNDIPGFSCTPTDGTFYVFPNMQEAISDMGMKDDLALSEYFIEGGVALVPGSAFGSPGYARISIATSMDKLETALQRIKTMVEEKTNQ